MTYDHVTTSIHAHPALPEVRKITFGDLRDALAEGFDDFWHKPSHVFFLGLIYPVVGLILFRLTFGRDLLPLLYPLAAGFALLGPFAAIGFYEISRRREDRLDSSWWHVLDLRHSKSLGATVSNLARSRWRSISFGFGLRKPFTRVYSECRSRRSAAFSGRCLKRRKA